MQLKMDLQNKPENEQVKKVLEKEKDKKFQPSWNELWYTGYTRPTGTRKDGIFQTKLTHLDRERLEEVKKAIEDGVIGTQVENMAKFTKTHALRLYKHLKEVTKAQTIKDIVENKPSNYHCIQTEEGFQRMLQLLKNETLIGLDTETTGVDTFGDDYIVGMSLSLDKADEHFYIPVRHEVSDMQLDADMVFRALKPFLESVKIGKVLHNAKFDSHMFKKEVQAYKKEGITLKNIVMDTMVSMHILNENEPSYALKKLATKWGKHFGFKDKSATYEELFGKGGFEKTPLDIATIYACKDTHLTLNFSKWIFENLKKRPKLLAIHELETKVLNVVIEMEQNGFLIDLDFASKYQETLSEQIKNIDLKLKEYFGDININSPKQLSEKLFDDLKLTNPNNGSVDASTLNLLKKEHEGVALLLEYRELTKLLSTYIEPLPQKISPLDGRLHGQFKQSGTVTGRFSSSDPNLQNIPYLARQIFIVPEDKLLIGCDFSKVEPTILAHMSGDEKFRKPFIEGTDIYSSLASGTFHKPIEECGDGSKERKMMKTGLLATMYGTSMFTLAEQLDISVEEAEAFIETFLSKYPVVASWIDGVHKQVDEKGFVETMFGRKRRFIGHTNVVKKFKKVEAKVEKVLGRKPKNLWQEKIPYNLKREYWDTSKEYFRVSRQSVNAIIQGTGADIMKKALINVYNLFESLGDDFRILATVHDEILMEVPKTITLEQINKIESQMIASASLFIPLKVDTEVMTRWGEGVSKNEYFKGVKK